MDKRFKKEAIQIFGPPDIRIDDAGIRNSANVTTYTFNRTCLLISIDSTGAPTSIQALIQTSPNQGTDWYTLQNDFLGVMIWNAAATATRVYEAFDFACPGALMRVRLVPTGCTAVNYFDVHAWMLPYTV
jgi:hypothetical protein